METPRSSAGSAAGMDRRSTTSESTSRSGRDQGKQQRGRRGQAPAHAGRWTPTSNPSNPPPQTDGDMVSARGGRSSGTSTIPSMASSGPQRAHAAAPGEAAASEPSRGVQGVEPATPSEHINAWAGSTGYVTLQSPANSVASTFRPPNSATQGVRNRTPSQRPMSVPPLKLGSSSTKRGGEGITPIPTSAAKAKPSSVGVYLAGPPPPEAPTVHTVAAPTASVIVAPTVHTVEVPIAAVITAPMVHTVDAPDSSVVLQT